MPNSFFWIQEKDWMLLIDLSLALEVMSSVELLNIVEIVRNPLRLNHFNQKNSSYSIHSYPKLSKTTYNICLWNDNEFKTPSATSVEASHGRYQELSTNVIRSKFEKIHSY